ncbi:hypothetical protein F4778DRAFT_601365 [Xylariomycetidae sp. FL2044]|nr:hypothetical protein F4778DRAFT_601365 [Xylariomycetidae sp. FL2044]
MFMCKTLKPDVTVPDRQMDYEIDEENMTRAMRINNLFIPERASVRSSSRKEDDRRSRASSRKDDDRRSREVAEAIDKEPLAWRRHNEVAIELDDYKRALFVHDLLKEENFSLVVMGPGRAIMQGFDFHLMMRTFFTATEAIACRGEPIIGQQTISVGEKRRNNRVPGLFDFNYKRINTPGAKEAMLRSKDPESTKLLHLFEVMLADPSPPGELKPGRCLQG